MSDEPEPEPHRRSTDRTGDDWTQPVRAAAGDDVATRSLIAAIGGLAGDIRDLIGTVSHDRRIRKVLLVSLGFAIALLFVVGATGAIFTIRAGHIQATQERQGVEIHDITRRFIECTTPGDPKAGDDQAEDRIHECFDDSQRNQAAVISRIVDTNQNGIPDTQELLANQAVAAKQRGIILPFTLAPPPTASTTTTTTIAGR